MTIKPSIALRALNLFLALSATFLPLKSTNVFADDAPPTCKDGYEYVEAVGKCYKACAEGWERNSETLRCRKVTTGSTSDSSSSSGSSSSTSSPSSESSSASPSSGSTATVPTCGDGYEYVEAVGKCYKACTAEQERNPETLRCRKITTEVTSESATSSGSASGSSSSTSGSSGQTSNSSTKSTSSAASSSPSSTTCQDGYEYVAAAGKCYKACTAEQERNPETLRCRKITTKNSSDQATSSGSSGSTSSSTKSASTSCQDGYEYVEATGKCYKACNEDQIRNPETNRCKKATASSTSSSTSAKSTKTNDGADYDVDVPNTGGGTSFVAVGAIIAIILAGLAFAAYQYREEIKAFYKKHFKKS